MENIQKLLTVLNAKLGVNINLEIYTNTLSNFDYHIKIYRDNGNVISGPVTNNPLVLSRYKDLNELIKDFDTICKLELKNNEQMFYIKQALETFGKNYSLVVERSDILPTEYIAYIKHQNGALAHGNLGFFSSGVQKTFEKSIEVLNEMCYVYLTK